MSEVYQNDILTGKIVLRPHLKTLKHHFDKADAVTVKPIWSEEVCYNWAQHYGGGDYIARKWSISGFSVIRRSRCQESQIEKKKCFFLFF